MASRSNRGHESIRANRLSGKDRGGNGVVVEQSEYFCGPMPHPDLLAKYENICPGAADRILAMAEKQSDHRMACEKVYLSSTLAQSGRGQLLAFILGLSGIVGSVFLLAIGVTWPGIGVFLGSLGSLITIFITGKAKADKEVKEKQEKE